MRTIKRYMALIAVFVFIMGGCVLLALDFETVKATWLSIGGAFISIGIGLVLGHVFDRKHLLPE